MMNNIVFLTAILVIVATAARPTGNIPQDIRNGYFEGRSGDIIFKQTSVTTNVQDRLAIVFDNSGNNRFIQNSDDESISATNIADIITRSLGAQPMNADYTPDFLNTNAFDRAQANIVVSLESVGSETMSKYKLENLNRLRKGSPFSADIDYQSYPLDSVSVATSIATGDFPSSHGVVSREWKGEDGANVQAMVDEAHDSHAQIANVADILLQTYDGKPLTISMSGDMQHSVAYRSNPHLIHDHPDWLSLSYSLNAETSAFSPVALPTTGVLNTNILSGDSSTASTNWVQEAIDTALSANKNQILTSLKGNDSFLNSLIGDNVQASLDAETDLVSVTHPAEWGTDKETSTFDLNNKDDYALFAELQHFSQLARQLTSNPDIQTLISDETPDLFSLTLTSLTRLVAKYGRGSSEHSGALHLVDAAIPSIIDKLQALYPKTAVTELLLLGTQESASAGVDSHQISQDLSTMLPSQESAHLMDYFPQLYLSSSSAHERATCQRLTGSGSATGFSAFCPGERPETQSLFQAQASAQTQATTITNVGVAATAEEIAAYQISLWVSIGLCLSVIAAVIAMMTMDFKKDPLLYSTFNPDWDLGQRKTR